MARVRVLIDAAASAHHSPSSQPSQKRELEKRRRSPSPVAGLINRQCHSQGLFLLFIIRRADQALFTTGLPMSSRCLARVAAMLLADALVRGGRTTRRAGPGADVAG